MCAIGVSPTEFQALGTLNLSTTIIPVVAGGEDVEGMIDFS